MKQTCLFIICLLASLVAYSENLDSILTVLDVHVRNRKFYEEELIRQTDSLQKESMKKHSEPELLDIWMKIMKLEKGHNGQKALIATEKALELAQKCGKREEYIHIILNKVDLLENFGLPQEGEHLLDSLLKDSRTGRKERITLLTAKYNLYDFYRVHELPGEISDAKLSSLKALTDSIRKYTSEYTQAITIQYNSYDYQKSIQILKKRYASVPEKEKTVLAIVISNKYFLLKDMRKRNYWCAVAAIHALRNVEYEYEPLIRLSASLAQEGEYERAERYALAAFENARTFNSRVRMSEVAPVLSQCLQHKNKLYEDALYQNKQRNTVIILLTLLLILVSGLFALLFRKFRFRSEAYRRQEEENQKIITSLKEEKDLKNEYITHFLELSLDSILKIEQFRNNVLMKLKSGEIEKLKKQITVSEQLLEFQKDCLKRFDLAFFRLYPHFTQEVNALLRDEERIKLSDTEILNNELRILALLKLGINDATRIATILGVAVRTVYFYRNRIKNKAKNRDTFEKDLFQTKTR